MDIFLLLKRCFSEGMTSMTAGLGGLQTAASLSLSLPRIAVTRPHMATRAGFNNARASARKGGATGTCKQRGVAQRLSQQR